MHAASAEQYVMSPTRAISLEPSPSGYELASANYSETLIGEG